MYSKRILILGYGMQGRAALYDLLNNTDDTEFIVADKHFDPVEDLREYPGERVTGMRLDASDSTALASVMEGATLVVEALPGIMALSAGKAAVHAGAHLVSSMYYINPGEQDPEKIREMRREMNRIDDLAKKAGKIILTEFGLDPGLDLVLGAQALKEFDEVEEFHSYGAGLPAPEAANNPLKYKFSWSAIGVMRAYLRPAWVIRSGRIVEIAADKIFAPENRHSIEADGFPDPLECYPNGNAAHYADVFGIQDTVREMGRYACRYPGHCDFWEIMANCGFMNEESIQVGNVKVSPAAFTSSLLEAQPQFRYAEDERDVVLVRVDLRGSKEGKKTRIIYELIDRRDLETGFTAMQRTVGFMMGFGARLILEGKLFEPGLLIPTDVPMELVKEGLAQFNISLSRKESS